jgi:hypothetical protein
MAAAKPLLNGDAQISALASQQIVEQRGDAGMSEKTHIVGASSVRRELLGAAAMGALAVGVSNFLPLHAASAVGKAAIPHLHVEVRESDLVDLGGLLATAKSPEREIFDDQSEGVQLASIQKLVRHWQSDWRKVEVRLNANSNGQLLVKLSPLGFRRIGTNPD